MTFLSYLVAETTVSRLKLTERDEPAVEHGQFDGVGYGDQRDAAGLFLLLGLVMTRRRAGAMLAEAARSGGAGAGGQLGGGVSHCCHFAGPLGQGMRVL